MNRCRFYCIVQKRVIRLSKGLFRETYSIKEFIFDPHIAYQSYKLTAELHLTRKEILFILENLKIIKNSYDNISKTLFIPYPTPKFVKTPQQNSLFLHFFKDFQSSKSCMIRFGVRFPEICFEKFINFELSSQIYIKIKKFFFFCYLYWQYFLFLQQTTFGNLFLRFLLCTFLLTWKTYFLKRFL